jgi:hypothetical protein
MSAVLNLILSHQSAPAVASMVGYWTKCVPAESILIAYGGPMNEFGRIEHEQKLFIDDPLLRTKDPQREFQSYDKLFRSAAQFLRNHENRFQFVHFAEYDHLPLIPGLNDLQIEQLKSEQADLLGYHLERVDGTNNPHFLYHASNSNFRSYWAKTTCRSKADVVLSFIGTGNFWTHEAFCAAAAIEQPFPIYMELRLPTLAHHLGFRVRDFGEQNRFVTAGPDRTGEIEQARNQGAWTLHPAKRLWKN